MSFQHVSDRPRKALDFYPTPPELTHVILPSLEKIGKKRSFSIWEPCCGDGAIARELIRDGHHVISTDINDYGWGAQTEVKSLLDFEKAPPGVTCIVTNPPYDRTLCPQIVRKSLELMKPVGGSVFMLLRHNWNTAGGRADLFEWPYYGKHTMMWRPHWFERKPGDPTPMHSYAWFEWNWSTPVPHEPREFHIKRKGK
jgi:hypothetical protein